jgi:hypothetical protein
VTQSGKDCCIEVGTHCNVTAYRNTVSWQCGRGWWPRNISKVGYAVTLRTCSLRSPYLSVASKGWYGYGLRRSGRATWYVTTVRSSRLPYIHNASGSRNTLGTPWCNASRIPLCHEARDESSDRNSVLSVTCNVTALRYAVTLHVSTHFFAGDCAVSCDTWLPWLRGKCCLYLQGSWIPTLVLWLWNSILLPIVGAFQPKQDNLCQMTLIGDALYKWVLRNVFRDYKHL